MNSLQISLPRNDGNVVIVFKLQILERLHVLYILLNIKIDLPQIEGCFESCTVLKSLEGFGNAYILFHIVVFTGHLLDY